MGTLRVGDPPRTVYLWYLAATPDGVLHRFANWTGHTPRRAQCGYIPRHGWAVCQTDPLPGRICGRCAAVIQEP